MSEVTRILGRIEQGDGDAAEQLLPIIYQALRKLAEQKLAQEKPGQTLQATALVHEAYIRLVDGRQAENWNSRGHFFAAAAEAMRRILVDTARRKLSKKRGGDCIRLELDQLDNGTSERIDDVLDIDEALGKLAKSDPQAAELVKLRYFAGLSIPEAAATLGVSPRTADFLWAYARVWLFRSELATKAADSEPKNGSFRNTLGVALYRAGRWRDAIVALDTSTRLLSGGYDSFNSFFLAMAQWRLDEKDAARKSYHRAVDWMEKNQPQDEELGRFRAEAGNLLGVTKPQD